MKRQIIGHFAFLCFNLSITKHVLIRRVFFAQVKNACCQLLPKITYRGVLFLVQHLRQSEIYVIHLRFRTRAIVTPLAYGEVSNSMGGKRYCVNHTEYKFVLDIVCITITDIRQCFL